MNDVTTLAARFAALGHAARLSIVRRLLAAHPDGLVVGELQEELEIPGSTLTHHLDALHHEGLVTKTREGRFLRYRAASEALRSLLDFLYAECCRGPASMAPPEPVVTLGIPPAATRGAKKAEAGTGKAKAGQEESAERGVGTVTAADPSWRAW